MLYTLKSGRQILTDDDSAFGQLVLDSQTAIWDWTKDDNEYKVAQESLIEWVVEVSDSQRIPLSAAYDRIYPELFCDEPDEEGEGVREF